jgi:predicted dithiol-disulfide oxidoreductase (DUF899 family)
MSNSTSNETIPHPPIVAREEWTTARKDLLAAEKELTKHYDRVSAQRRRLPMVKLEKNYVFEGAEGQKSLLDLFEGRRQLVVYHFMFDPAWEKGCPGCTWMVNSLGDLSDMAKNDTTFMLISRAPIEKLMKYKAEMGWNKPWVSSYGSDFNYDFHVTLDKTVVPLEHNYRTQADVEARSEKEPYFSHGETHGMSVFFRINDDVYHTYSAFARGVECITDSFRMLDLTPYGRQQDFEDSPAGWPQKPTYG